MQRIRWFLILLSVLSPLAAKAQLGLYGTFTGTRLSGAASDWLYGGTAGAYLNHGIWSFLSTGLDLRGSAGNNSGVVFTSGSFGPRLALRPFILPVKPYAEVGGGGAHEFFRELDQQHHQIRVPVSRRRGLHLSAPARLAGGGVQLRWIGRPGQRQHSSQDPE